MTTEIRYEFINGSYTFNIGGPLGYSASADIFREYTGIGRSTAGMVVVTTDVSEALCQSSVIVGLMDGWELV